MLGFTILRRRPDIAELLPDWTRIRRRRWRQARDLFDTHQRTGDVTALWGAECTMTSALRAGRPMGYRDWDEADIAGRLAQHTKEDRAILLRCLGHAGDGPARRYLSTLNL